jgi:peptidyl-prolyl cis-trans isomerase SurA
MKKILFLTFVIFCGTFSLNSEIFAQNSFNSLRNSDVIDKIVAIVGNEIIMKSDIDATLLMEIERGAKIDFNDENVRSTLLEQFINNYIVIVKAEEDSVAVSEEMIEERWNLFIQERMQYFGSIERMESYYKKSMSQMKIELKEDIRKRLMAQQLEMQQFSNVSITAKEVEDFYRDFQDSLPQIPEQVELSHIVKFITPDTTAKQNTYNLAKNVRDSLISGGDFAEFVKKYSADIGSAQDGGNLGWAEKGKLVAEFEKAAYSLQIGEISMPVESPFGFHIIKVNEKAKDSINASHILFKLIQTESDIEKVRNFLDSLRLEAQKNDDLENNKIENTKAENNYKKFEELATQFSDEKETKGFGGSLGKTSLSELAANSYTSGIANSIKDLKDGEISEPAAYSMDPTKQGMNIVLRKATIPEHKPTLETDYDYIKKWATDYKTENLRKQWIVDLKKEIYWEIFE